MDKETFTISLGPDLEDQRSGCLGHILARDDTVDIAFIDVSECRPKTSIKVLHPSRNIYLGEQVFIFGNQIGHFYRNSLSVGHISHVKRYAPNDIEGLFHIQFTGGVWAGSSGGAVLNNEGYLIGLVRANATAIQPGFFGQNIVDLPHIALGVHRDLIVRFLSQHLSQRSLKEVLSQ